MVPRRVLDLTEGGASLAGLVLADLGADVVLIEPPGGVADRHRGPFAQDRRGPNASLEFWARNRNKRSIALDLDRPEDRERFLVFADGADAVIESRPAGWLAARGLDYAALSARNPGLVLASITPFGSRGPKAGWAATDLTVTAASGVMQLTGDEDRPPLASFVPQAFQNAAADAALGVLLALFERERSGRGQHIDVSAQTSMMMTTQSHVLAHAYEDQQAARTSGGVRAGPLRIRFVYECKDGFVNVTFLFGPALGPFSSRLFHWMWEEGFIDESTRDKDFVEYGALILSGQEPISELERCMTEIERFTRAHTKEELYRASFERRVLIVPLSDAADLRHSPQLEARAFWVPLEHEDLGVRVDYPGPFVKLEKTPVRYARRPPLLDEHRAELLMERRRPAAPRTRADDVALPLSGLRVLDFTWVYAGPAITRVLADYGATVIRIENEAKVDALRTGGPYRKAVPHIEGSGGYHNMNVGKLGLSLDLGKPQAREVVRKLVREWADVVVENFSPRAMRTWELDWEHLRRQKPGLVMLSSCLQGQTGPHANLSGYGTMGASLGGFGVLTGWPDRAPSAPLGAYTDYVSPRFATAALLAAIGHQRETGEGQHLDCSQIEASAPMLGASLLEYTVNKRVPRALGNDHPHWAPSGVYPVAGDDRWIALATPDETSWRALAALVGGGLRDEARFATNEGRLEHRAALNEALAAWTGGQDVAALEAALQAASVPAHRVSRNADLWADPQMAARGHFIELEHPTQGALPLEAARIRLERTPPVYRAPGPMFGQHNDEILRGILALSDDEITALVVAGALG